MYRHRFDPSSLVAAVFFLLLSGLYLADGLQRARPSFLWTVPAVLFGLLAVVVVRIAFRARRRPPR